MAKFNFKYQPMFRINKPQSDNKTVLPLSNTLQALKAVPSRIEFDKKLNYKLSSFEERTLQTETNSKTLDERAKDIERRKNELNDGISKLPEDLPAEFMNAVNAAIASLQESINNEAREVAEIAETARNEANNVLYEIRREQERLNRSVTRFQLIRAIPFLGSFGKFRYEALCNKHAQLQNISSSTSNHYESLLTSKSIVNNLTK